MNYDHIIFCDTMDPWHSNIELSRFAYVSRGHMSDRGWTEMSKKSNTDFLQNSPITIQQNYFNEPSVGRTTSRNLKFPFNMIWSCFAFNDLPVLKIWLCYEFTVSEVRQRSPKVVRVSYYLQVCMCVDVYIFHEKKKKTGNRQQFIHPPSAW